MTDWYGDRKVIVIDFETYWTDELTLKKMSVEEYVSHPSFEILGMGYWTEKTGHGFVWRESDARRKLLDLGVHEPGTLTVAHNMAFDGYIANRLLAPEGKVIRLPVCTIGMARATPAGRLSRVSLKGLAKHFRLPDKGDILQFKDMRFLDFQLRRELMPALRNYCLNDVDLTRRLADTLGPMVTPEALEFIALSMRMYIEPCLRLDRELLEQYRAELVARQDAGVERLRQMFKVGSREEFLKMLRSRDTFTGLLRELGAEVPMKVSKAKESALTDAMEEAKEILAVDCSDRDEGTLSRVRKLLKIIRDGVMTPALAKSDLAFQDLMDSPDEDVADLCRLRAENNSSIALSRADAFLGVARRRNLLPVPLSPYRAHTGRYAAGNEGGGRTDGFNLQNLPKRTGDMTLRRAILAPMGHVLVAGDSSQIEARVGAWLAGQDDLLDTFRRGDDPYVEMATRIFTDYDYEEILRKAKKDKDPAFVHMRNVAKEVILSSQYGISGDAFGRRLLQQKVRLADDTDEHYAEARNINKLYRNHFRNISRTWRELDGFLRAACNEYPDIMTCSCSALRDMTIESDDHNTLIIRLPNGFPLVYPELRMDGRDVSYLQMGGFTAKPVRKSIYGGLLFNNLTQGMAFAILAHQAVRLSCRYRIVANVHDSWVTAVPRSRQDSAEKDLLETLRTPPDWAKDLPLDAEVKSGDTYEVA